MRKYTLDTDRVFSAGQIAAAVGVSPRAVRSALSDVRPRGVALRSGNLCDGYSFDALPDGFKEKIEQQQFSLNYRSAQAVLSSPKKQWQPPRPLGELPAEAVEFAHSLKCALSYYIGHRNDLSFRAGELIARASKDWEQAFRKPIQRRQIERTISMVLERDNGREEFDRIEIYLPAWAFRASASIDSPSGGVSLPGLNDALSVVSDVSVLSSAERAAIWRAALIEFESLVEDGLPEKKAKRGIFDFLSLRVPRLAESRNALRMQFERKWSAFSQDGIEALRDKRKECSGRRIQASYQGHESLSFDERQLLARANQVGGGLSQAFRELYLGVEVVPGRRVQFSEAFRTAYFFDPRANKSYVPQSLRDKLRPLLKSIAPMNHGPKAARLASPSIHRDWSNVAAGAWYQSDDETSNHYVWFECEDGEYEFDGMRFDVLRPQILPLVDVRTDYVLSILLLCQRNYNSRAIRSLILNTCQDEGIGLPFEGFSFEQGIWKSRNVQALVSWTEVDDAFARSGLQLRMRHARTPKAKIIERIFSREQNMMQELPGYAGRDERNDGYERVRQFLASLKRHGQPLKEAVAPWKGLLSAGQYLDRLQAIYSRFNREPQNGKRLQGMSPLEAWEKLSGGRAHNVLPDSLRYLLATEQTEKPITVSREGICLRFGNEKRYFFENERLGLLVGEKVNVRWNADCPDHVVVVHPASDPKGLKPFVVPVDTSLDAMSASAEDFKEARRRRGVFTQGQRTLFRVLNHEYGRTVRDELLGDDSLRAAGNAHRSVERRHAAKAVKADITRNKAQSLAREAGFDSSKIKDPDRAIQELEGIDRLRARLLNEESAYE